MNEEKPDMVLRVYNFDLSMSDEDIKFAAVTAYEDRTKKSGNENNPAVCALFGFDKDPRPIWLIPEAVAFCKKIMASGFASELFVTTHIKQGLPEGITTESLGHTLGSFEVWAISKGYKMDNLMVTPGLWKEFEEDLLNSNEIHKKVIKECSK
jgi:hypothetical protein